MWGRRKYGNKKVKVGGIEFDSKFEADEFLILKSFQERGQIRDLMLQVKIRLSDKPKGQNRHYIADFVFFDMQRGLWVVWDSKGLKIEPYQTKRDWLLDKFKGFVFIESSRERKKEYIPYGDIELNFKGE